MAGFQLNLKRNVQSKQDNTKKQKISIGLGPNRTSSKVPGKRTNAINSFDDGSDDEPAVTKIDGFDSGKGGAISGSSAISQAKKPLIITPKNLNLGIKKQQVYTPNKEQNDEETLAAELKEKESRLQYGVTKFDANTAGLNDKDTVAEERTQSKEDQIRSSILKGEKLHEKKGLVIPMNNSKKESDEEATDFDKVPVEQFGAAMLRGMGWKPKTTPNKTSEKTLEKSLEHRKKGILLGIGAKAVEGDLMEDIHGKKGTKLLAPLIRRIKNGVELNVTKDQADYSVATSCQNK
ncbi:uncharacterized protein CANTADRAFT_5310 [Suhomyces tanzawaensis NRRL Y-17324]|uniref:Pre-mRNA-splicing factor n=1 Tax=Suhomyces tanzawaensis NRRL Y-17324 TaxID=984487 RepID=A0A1E4SJ91_9ASCO|nr:uncharacterized protein CANTADRAFT_5310 [Suhomyces tanzawaensis NRRL Y-17324]ODV79576.1 hypothetical protein CANTADRAFT_5310 [Suhomyces tanzawaensis NRRL Y-17324]